jgi:hypothetical protein
MSQEISNTVDWVAGYICAVATLLRNHADDVAARELLDCIDLPPAEDVIDTDREILIQFGFLKE